MKALVLSTLLVLPLASMPAATHDDLRARYGEHAAVVLDAPSRIEATAGGFTVTRHAGDAVRLSLPRLGSMPVALVMEGRATVRIREESMHGSAERVDGAVRYARDAGRSYWTATETGIEEWLSLESGAAVRGAIAARWTIDGATPRLVDDVVLLSDARGETVLRVTAPRAWAASGRAVGCRLAVAGTAITLEVDADGEPVLVDPSWVPVGMLSVTRAALGSGVLLASGRVLVAGGVSGGTILSTAELFDPTTITWSPAAAMPSNRMDHTTTLLASGSVLVAGGGMGSDTTAAVYDPATNAWTPTGAVPGGHMSHTATLLGSGRVLLVGGLTGASPTVTCHAYDPSTNAWSTAAPLGTARYDHVGVRLASGRVLVAGGYGALGDLYSYEVYDPTANTWTLSTGLTHVHALGTATLLPSGRVLVAGGLSSSNVAGATADLYDPTTNTWSTTGMMSSARYLHSATLLPSGQVLVAGGHDDAGYLTSAELYDPTSGTWSRAPAMLTPRDGHTATLLSDGHVLVAGGLTTGDVGTATAELFVEGTYCGNAIVESGEACDDGNFVSGDCCDACAFEASTVVCRASIGACDLAETCTGTSTTCPGDGAQPEGTSCGGAPSGACDAQDVCMGTVGASAMCLARFATASTVCRAALGECDVADHCTGADATCPSDVAQPEGNPCGPIPSGACDAQDQCVGTLGALAVCDPRVAPATTSCPATCSAGTESAATTCDGTSAVCPGATQACAPYACGATACLTSCDTAADCASGLVCVAHACVPPSDAGVLDDAGTTTADAGRADGSATVDAGSSPPSTGGCGCATAGTADHRGWLWLLVVALVIRRRSPRRRRE